jgi:hypothetical protein
MAVNHDAISMGVQVSVLYADSTPPGVCLAVVQQDQMVILVLVFFFS